jgi:mono/diheme cytochrome c family protein
MRLLWLASLLATLLPADDAAFFEKNVRPLLATQCYACHSAKATIVQGNLRVDSREALLKGGHSGPALLPGDPQASRLLQVLRHERKPTMPPWGKLKPEQIAALEQWVARGAYWPPETPPPPASPTNGKPDPTLPHWAFQPIAPPKTAANIDTFLDSARLLKGLSPNPPADPATVLRRVYFDLTGLPPSPEAMRAFLRDPSPHRYRQTVDELLSSPAFAEHWGRYWLDVTYYGDTMDTNAGIPATHAWRYRDYVIQSFQEDKPINRFIQEQIAGDLMPATDPFEKRQMVVATGYLVLGPWALVQADKVQLKMDVVDLQVDAIGRGILGLTLGCARCHDHKFDPVTQREYFGLAGILASTRTIYGKQREDGVFSDINKVPLFESAEEAAQRAARQPAFERELAEIRRQLALVEALPKEDKTRDARLNRLRRREKMVDFNAPAPPFAYAAQDEDQPSDCRINIRGNAHQLGEPAPRTFVRVAMFGSDTPPMKGSGRLQLAQWLTDPRNPLTPRVYVNRVWQKLFGAGLVRTPDNFGLRGEPPTHPELLDYLAHRFLAQGWSTRQLIREIVLSRAYQMSSASSEPGSTIDPDNRLLWRMNRRRLEAEAIRDAILVISGQFDPRRGGPTLPLESLETFAPDLGKVNPPRMIHTGRLPENLRHRRTVYLPVYRQAQMDDLDLLNLFDFANNSQINASRRETIVPTQALFLMNSPWILDQARHLAVQLLERESLLDHERVERLIELIFNRPPHQHEVSRALDFLAATEQSLTEEKARHPHREAWARLIQAMLASNEFLFRL